MVKHLLIACLLLPAFLFSGEFTASVNRNPIQAGEKFTLNLTLKDATAHASPDIGPLKGSFTIISQHQSSSTTLMNGHFSSSTTWKISLSSQHEGEAIIPSISVRTNQGELSTEPLKIRVAKGQPSNASDPKVLYVLTEVNNAQPYKNEPIFYNVKLISKPDLSNVSIQKFNIEDALVESNGQPKVYKKIMDGINMNVIEFSYLITPLKAGPLMISSLAIQGAMPIRKQSLKDGFFDDDFDSFFIMPGFQKLQPFTETTKEIALQVQPPVAGLTPWLPAKSLILEEIWNESQTMQVGEPISRGFIIRSEGILSSQLPNLQEQQHNMDSLKIYADKPEMNDEMKEGIVRSFRKEQYTLIPQKSGTLTLPEINLTWWDTINHKKNTAHIPSRSIHISPAPQTAIPPSSQMQQDNFPAHMYQENNPSHRDPLLYALIAGLAVLLSAALFWVIALQKKIVRLTEMPSAPLKKMENNPPPQKQSIPAQAAKPPVKDKKEKLPDLNPT